MNTIMRIGLFGQVSLAVDDKSITKFTTSRVRDLLVLLALARGEVCSRDTLVSKLWPGSGPSNERNRLAVALYSLRKTIAELGGDERSVIAAGKHSITLLADRVDCDLWQFHDAVASGEQANEEAEREMHFTRAVSFYTGELAPMVTRNWARVSRDFARNRHADACFWLFQRAAANDREPEAQKWLDRLRQTDPNSTRTFEATIRWLVSQGDFAGAMERTVAMKEFMASKGIPLGTRFEALVQSVEETWVLDETQQDIEFKSTPTLSVLLADSDQSNLDQVAREFDGLRSGNGASVFKNPLVAKEVAQKLLKERPRSRLYLTVAIMNPTDPIPAETRRTHGYVPEGQLWLSRSAAAILEENTNNVVFERTDVRRNYRLV